MKYSGLLILFVVLSAVPLVGNAQQVLDGLYVKEHTPNRKPIPYTHLREADVMWNKRIWRTIDLKEKMNHPLYYPLEPIQGRISLFDVIKKGISEGTLMVFDDTYDDFRMPLTRNQAIERLESVNLKQVEDPDNPGVYVDVIDTNRVTSKEVIQYLIKEDWFFDNQRSVMDVRIIGICPVIRKYDTETGAERGVSKLFWLYFPNCRELFANAETFNRANDAERRTYEDIFWKRMFSSFIYKESNVFDREINEYAVALDALLEADKIKHDIFNLEMDMWHY
jgi:gliding motility associated protien GldN